MCPPTPQRTTATEEKNQGKRSIRFAPEDQIKEVRLFPRPTRADEEAAWLTDYDYNEIKDSFTYIVFMMDMDKHEDVENEEYTTVGLEKLCSVGSFVRHEHKAEYYHAVFTEQKRQRKEMKSVIDFDRIGQACSLVTERPTYHALLRANRIERDIYEFLEDTRTVCYEVYNFNVTAEEDPADFEGGDDDGLGYGNTSRSEIGKEKKIKSLEKLWDRQEGEVKADTAICAIRRSAFKNRAVRSSSLNLRKTLPEYGIDSSSNDNADPSDSTQNEYGYAEEMPQQPPSVPHRRAPRRGSLTLLELKRQARAPQPTPEDPVVSVIPPLNNHTSTERKTPERNPSSRMRSRRDLASMSVIATSPSALPSQQQQQEDTFDIDLGYGSPQSSSPPPPQRRSANSYFQQSLPRVTRRGSCGRMGGVDNINTPMSSSELMQMHMRGMPRRGSMGSSPSSSSSLSPPGPLDFYTNKDMMKVSIKGSSSYIISQLNELQRNNELKGTSCQRAVIGNRRPAKRTQIKVAGAAGEA